MVGTGGKLGAGLMVGALDDGSIIMLHLLAFIPFAALDLLLFDLELLDLPPFALAALAEEGELSSSQSVLWNSLYF